MPVFGGAPSFPLTLCPIKYMSCSMNSHESLAFPNSLQNQSSGSVKMLATIVDEQPQKVMPSKRYTRRSSVTRYSLEQMAVPSDSMMSDANQTSTLDSSEEPHLVSEESKGDHEQPLGKVVSPSTITKKSSSGRYGRRSSVTRYSLQQTAIPETRSLSPVPFSRRGGSSTKITVEQVSDFTPEEEEQPVTPRPKSRYRRRCSVTKYSLDSAQTVAKQHYAATHQGDVTTPSKATTTTVAVKVTVEEPIDTVDSIEHRHMLANDTIESSGAGDLIVGWNQATASFMDEDDEASTDGCDADVTGGGEVKQKDDPAIATTVVSPKPIKSSPWWSGKGGSNDDKGEEKEGIWGVLQKNFSVSPFWIKNLGNETIDSKKKTFRDTSKPSIEVEKSILSTPSA